MNSSVLQSQCIEMENILLNSNFGNFLLFGQLPLLLVTLIFTAILTFQYFQQKILIHGNLMILFVNIVLVYFVAIWGQFAWLLRYRILLFYYTDPCQLMTPLWMVALFYGPTNFQSVAYPALHFCVMVERVRATLLAAKYEREGQWLGILMVAIILIFSGAYMGFIIVAAFNVPEMAIQGMPYLTSVYSSTLSLVVNIVALFVVIFTALCDWRITVLNKRIREQSRNYGNYSLARNFQLNENSLAMRLILPMDIAYALLYSIYSIGVIYIRLNRFTLPALDYSFYYNLINTLLYVYAAFTMIVYIRFVKFMSKSQRRNVNPKPREEEAKVHFGQLKTQWQ